MLEWLGGKGIYSFFHYKELVENMHLGQFTKRIALVYVNYVEFLQNDEYHVIFVETFTIAAFLKVQSTSGQFVEELHLNSGYPYSIEKIRE